METLDLSSPLSSPSITTTTTSTATTTTAISSSSSSSSRFRRVKEVGLLPLEALPLSPAFMLDLNSASWTREDAAEILRWINLGGGKLQGNPYSLPLIGASPDGIVNHLDGTCEVLEVKCSAPFASAGQGTQELTISSRPMKGVGVWHIPQLQLEILCAGPSCTGALLITLSALNGAVIYRIKRDNAYIAEMMRWMRLFYRLYVNSSANPRPPPENFFYTEDEGEKFKMPLDAIGAAFDATSSSSSSFSSTAKQSNGNAKKGKNNKNNKNKKKKLGKNMTIPATNDTTPTISPQNTTTETPTVPPPTNPSNDLNDLPLHSYADFLRRTMALARGAEVVSVIDQEHVQRGPVNEQLLV